MSVSAAEEYYFKGRCGQVDKGGGALESLPWMPGGGNLIQVQVAHQSRKNHPPALRLQEAARSREKAIKLKQLHPQLRKSLRYILRILSHSCLHILRTFCEQLTSFVPRPLSLPSPPFFYSSADIPPSVKN